MKKESWKSTGKKNIINYLCDSFMQQSWNHASKLVNSKGIK